MSGLGPQDACKRSCAHAVTRLPTQPSSPAPPPDSRQPQPPPPAPRTSSTMVKDRASLKDSSLWNSRYMSAVKHSTRDSTTSTNMICGQARRGRPGGRGVGQRVCAARLRMWGSPLWLNGWTPKADTALHRRTPAGAALLPRLEQNLLQVAQAVLALEHLRGLAEEGVLAGELHGGLHLATGDCGRGAAWRGCRVRACTQVRARACMHSCG